MHFLLVSGKGSTLSNAIRPYLRPTLEKLQNLEKSIFCCSAGGRKSWKNCKTWKNVFFASLREGPNAIQRYPSLSQTLKKLQNLENAFFAGFREGFNAIQRYPSLFQTLEKLQNLEKSIFAVLREVAKLGKITKPGKMHFFAGFREGFNTI